MGHVWHSGQHSRVSHASKREVQQMQAQLLVTEVKTTQVSTQAGLCSCSSLPPGRQSHLGHRQPPNSLESAQPDLQPLACLHLACRVSLVLSCFSSSCSREAAANCSNSAVPSS